MQTSSSDRHAFGDTGPTLKRQRAWVMPLLKAAVVITLKSVRVLLWAKERRLGTLQAQLVQAQQAEAASAAAVAQARAQVQERQADVDACQAQIDRLMGSESVRPEHLIAQQHVLDTRQAHLASAQTAAAAAEQKLREAQVQCRQARSALQRGESQIDQLKSKREQLLRDIDAQQEDAQDEESEEAAVSRLVGQRNEARRRAAADRSRQAGNA